jgi:hypothetical protein
MAIHTTQMISPQLEKNSNVNQSMSAATDRSSVGKAKAANVAKAGSANNNVRSDEPVVKVAAKDTPLSQSGNAKCLLMWRVNNW